MKPHQEKFIILINFKRLTGDRAKHLTVELNKIDNRIRENFDIIAALQPRDALHIAGNISLPIFIQDACCGSGGSGDGFLEGIEPRLISQAKIRGIILSHPEKKVPLPVLAERTSVVKKLGLEIMLCATTLNDGIELNRRFEPEYLTVENEQLIGQDISISDFCPGMVEEAIRVIDNRVLFGGGIRSPRDIHFIWKTGGAGVLISSLILKSPHPLATLTDLLNPTHYID